MKTSLLKRTALVWILAVSGCLTFAEEPTLEVGDQAPRLQTGRWLRGEPVRQFESGKAYLVEFWATWCGPCRTSIPHLNELYSKFKDRGLIVIGQNCWQLNESLVEPFIRRMGDRMTYRVALDDKNGSERGQMAETWMAAAGRNGIPAAFLVDLEGRIAWIGDPMRLTEELIEDVLTETFDVRKAALEYETQQRNAQDQDREAAGAVPSEPERDRGLEYMSAKPLPPEQWEEIRSRWIELAEEYDSTYQKHLERQGEFQIAYQKWLEAEQRADSTESHRAFEALRGESPRFSHDEWLARFERIIREVSGTDKELDLYGFWRIFLLNRRLDDEMAERYLGVLRETPQHFLVGFTLWADYAALSRTYGDEIAARLEDLVRSSPDNPQASAIHLILGKRAKEQGEVNAAKTHLQQVIREFPENVDWLGTGLTRVAKGLLNEMENLNIGQLAPAFEATTLRGKRVSLAELRGKVVLLDFWATWCGPCVSEVPMLKKLHEQLAEKDFVLISISADDDPNALAEFVKEHQLRWPQIREGTRDNGEISRKYSVEYWPLKYLIGRDGRIAAKDLGGSELKERVVEMVTRK